MKLRIALLAALAALASCDDDPARPPRPALTLTVAAVPLEAPVDHGWATVGSDSFRMEPGEGRLLAAGIPVEPGPVEVSVRGVDANETDVFAGSGEVDVEEGVEVTEIEILLRVVRPDLRLVRLEFVPARPVAGDSMSIIVHVGNEGSGRSGPTELVLRVGAETEGVSYPVGPMNPGDALQVERRLLLEQAQFYQVLAFVDPRNLVPEFINTNNAAIGLIEVRPAP